MNPGKKSPYVAVCTVLTREAVEMLFIAKRMMTTWLIIFAFDSEISFLLKFNGTYGQDQLTEWNWDGQALYCSRYYKLFSKIKKSLYFDKFLTIKPVCASTSLFLTFELSLTCMLFQRGSLLQEPSNLSIIKSNASALYIITIFLDLA